MSYFGTLLAFEAGTRLTGVTVQPLATHVQDRDAWLLLDVVALGTTVDADVAERAQSPFLPDKIAGIHGVQADGIGWFASFQFVPADVEADTTLRAGRAGVQRALDLTGTQPRSHRSIHLAADAIRNRYDEAGTASVGDWDIVDLLVGLVLDLANLDLRQVVDDAAPAGLAGIARDEFRRERLHLALRNWSATYEGPKL